MPKRNPIRKSLIILQMPVMHKDLAPRGLCHWCGHPIELVDAAHPSHRQRARHRGDKYEKALWIPVERTLTETEVKILKRNCNREFKLSMCWNGQNACRWRAWKAGSQRSISPNAYEIRCVDCNCLCEIGQVYANAKRIGFSTRQRKVIVPWEADHKIELVDGGEHSLANLEPRCHPCHVAKTNRERRLRRELEPVLDALNARA